MENKGVTGSDFRFSSLALAAENGMNCRGARVGVRSLVPFSRREVTLAVDT